ncbi:MAG: hypothetical protein HGB29_08640 [Chlorobiaceae bacterium]|nr:hypothetical protein [Chlorobiaceae bacterium]
MKIQALLILVLLGLAACTTTYKGSIKSSINGDGQPGERQITSHSEPTDNGYTVAHK